MSNFSKYIVYTCKYNNYYITHTCTCILCSVFEGTYCSFEQDLLLRRIEFSEWKSKSDLSTGTTECQSSWT